MPTEFTYKDICVMYKMILKYKYHLSMFPKPEFDEWFDPTATPLNAHICWRNKDEEALPGIADLDAGVIREAYDAAKKFYEYMT